MKMKYLKPLLYLRVDDDPVYMTLDISMLVIDIQII